MVVILLRLVLGCLCFVLVVLLFGGGCLYLLGLFGFVVGVVIWWVGFGCVGWFLLWLFVAFLLLLELVYYLV